MIRPRMGLRCGGGGMLDTWQGGGELAARAGERNVGPCLAGGGPAFYLFTRSRSRWQNSSRVLHSPASIKSRSRSASWACCTSNLLCSAWSCSPLLSGRRCRRRFAGRWPLGRPLALDDSGGFRRCQWGVQFFPGSPKGGTWELFLHRILW